MEAQGGRRSRHDWPRDAVRAVLHEAAHFFRTGWEFSKDPAAFADAWVAGTRTFMNPLGFVAASVVFLGPLSKVGLSLLRQDAHHSLAEELAHELAPQVHYVAFGVVIHLTLRLLGSKRPLSDTVAISLYAGGSIAIVMQVLAQFVAAWLAAQVSEDAARTALAIGLGLAFGLFCMWLGIALTRLHAAARWKLIVGVMAACIVTGLLFGIFQPDGEWGMHWVVTPSPFRIALGL